MAEPVHNEHCYKCLTTKDLIKAGKTRSKTQRYMCRPCRRKRDMGSFSTKQKTAWDIQAQEMVERLSEKYA